MINPQFLCDSGACKTVLKTYVPGLKQSQNSIWVKSADGQTHKEYFSKALTIEDEVSNGNRFADQVAKEAATGKHGHDKFLSHTDDPPHKTLQVLQFPHNTLFYHYKFLSG